MGKTSQSLTILVDSRWIGHPLIEALIAKGHTVHHQPQPREEWSTYYDVILSPIAHLWHDSFWEEKYLDAAIKAARRRYRDAKPNKET